MIAIPDKFLLKYDPPKICVVYHFKEHSVKDQYYRDLPLKIEADSEPIDMSNFLFKNHKFYFDEKIVRKEQVIKLMKILIEKQNERLRK